MAAALARERGAHRSPLECRLRHRNEVGAARPSGPYPSGPHQTRPQQTGRSSWADQVQSVGDELATRGVEDGDLDATERGYRPCPPAAGLAPPPAALLARPRGGTSRLSGLSQGGREQGGSDMKTASREGEEMQVESPPQR